jgi:hypothetical protein
MTTAADRAKALAAKYAATTSERQHDQNFIRDFVGVFTDRDPADIFRFQYPVETPRGTTGAIDALWESHILFEMKSAGKDLHATLKDQVRPYVAHLAPAKHPQMYIISDFQNFLVVDPDGTKHEFPLADLHAHVSLFTPIFDGLPAYLRSHGTVNEQAASLLSAVLKGLRKNGYSETDLPALATRLLFALYADDNYVWKNGTFHGDVLGTPADGATLGRVIDGIFRLLDSPNADATDYCYINGSMFAGDIAVPVFDADTREALLEACEYDWRGLDPMIFGTIYQSAMDADERHAEGAHYTHEQDILDVLGPAFLDNLKAQYAAAQGSATKLRNFLKRLSEIEVLDPSCGSGNFLMVAYRELRALETAASLDLAAGGAKTIPAQRVSLAQFHGIEYNALSASVARTSLWLTLHAADQRHTEAMGELMWDTFPLKDVADIRHANAVTTDWNAEFPNLTAIVGNPPYISAKKERDGGQNAQQVAERKALGIKGGMMDYAHIWMVKSAQYIAEFPDTRSGLVVTDSVAQGTQASGLWSHPAMQDVYPIFGRQSYVWPGDASVRVVNYGLGSKPEAVELRAEDRSMIPAAYLTPYLTPTDIPSRATANVSRTAPAWMVNLKNGTSYADFGHYAKLGDDLAVIQRDHPEMLVNKVSSSNLLSGKDDPVLWFGNRTSKAVAHKAIAPRREAVRIKRGAGHPKGPEWVPSSVVTGTFMVVPATFSKSYERTPVVILSGTNYMTQKVYYAPVDWFMAGLVMSKRAMDAQIAGGSKMGKGGDVQYGTGYLYGMPAPTNDTPELRAKIAAKAQECIAARPGPAAECMKVTNMPESLAKLHRELDALVDEWWG